MMSTLTNQVFLTVMADGPPQNSGADFGKASPVGLLVVVLLLVATMGLMWSMNRQLRRVPASFDPDHPELDQAADEGTDVVTGNEQPGTGDAVG